MLTPGKVWVLAMLAFPKPEKLRVASVPAKRPPLPSAPPVSDARGMGRAEERAAFQADQGTGKGWKGLWRGEVLPRTPTYPGDHDMRSLLLFALGVALCGPAHMRGDVLRAISLRKANARERKR